MVGTNQKQKINDEKIRRTTNKTKGEENERIKKQ